MLTVQVLGPLLVKSESGVGHLSAASGLARIGHRLYVVADDENTLGAFSLLGDQRGRRVRLFGGDLPSEPRARKAAKPDLEALALLPAFAGYPHGALLALGSGSRWQRQRGALLALDAAGELCGAVKELDLAPLYAPLHERYERLNIEGAFVSHRTLCLLQRGSGATPINALIGFDWALTQRWLQGLGAAPEPVATTHYDLGDIDGVPLCFTDGVALPDGGWMFCAAAEATDDNYADGPCCGSAVGIVAANGELSTLLPLSVRSKVEGIAVTVENGMLQLLMVSDADDPDTPALLLAAKLQHPRP